MTTIRMQWITILFLTMVSAPASADSEEVRYLEVTGETHHGVLEVNKPAAPVSVDDMREVDQESMEQLLARWASFRAKTSREIPPLPYDVPVTDTRAPNHPPTTLGTELRGGDSFVLFQNSSPSSAAAAGFSATVNEPSVVAVGQYVFATGNWFGASSNDGGDTFGLVNPFTGPFSDPPSGSFCCDQVTAYDPDRDTLYFMQQYLSDATTGVHRINVDQGADGTFDCFYDLTPQTHGFAANNFNDFPDLVVSDNWLYHSSNVFSTAGLGFTGAYVARYDLDGLASCSSVPFDTYTDPTFFSFKLTRGATDTMYFADHISTASMRIWAWADALAAPVSVDRTVTTWSNSTRTCPGPDGRDWCGFIDRRMAGAYVADGQVGFMWVASQDATFGQPYTRVAQFSTGTLTLVGEPLIWSNSTAFVYPSVSVNRNGDLGGTIMAGGSSLFTTCAVWLADDVNGDAFAPLENQVVLIGTSGPSLNRSGDYTSTHTYHPNDLQHAGTCFAYDSTTSAESRYVRFGRESSSMIFMDGFDTGNTSAWTFAVP